MSRQLSLFVRLGAALLLAASACDATVPVGSPFPDASLTEGPDAGGSPGEDAGGLDAGAIDQDGGDGGALDAGDGGTGDDAGAGDGSTTGDAGGADSGANPPLPPGITAPVAGAWPGLIVNTAGRPAGVAFDGRAHVVVWTDSRTHALMAARVDPTGALLDPAGLVLRADEPPTLVRGQVALAYGGDRFLVVFIQSRIVSGRAVPHLAAIRLDRDLVPLDTTPIELSARAASTPSATFDGSHFVVAWSDSGSPRVARVDLNGTVLDPGGLVVDRRNDAPVEPIGLATAGGVTAVVWAAMDPSGARRRVVTRRLRSDGAFADATPVELGRDTEDNHLPDVASNGTDFLVTWTTVSGSARIVSAARMGSSGEPVGLPPEIELERGGTELNTPSPVAVWAGQAWHVYLTRRGLAPRAHRIATDGAVSASVDLPIVEEVSQNIVSSDGQRMLWLAPTLVPGGRNLLSLQLDGDLQPVSGTPSHVIGAAPTQQSAQIASAPTGALVAWFEGLEQLSLHAALVDAAGQPLSSPPIVLAPETYEAGGGVSPIGVTFDGTQYLVVWLKRRSSSTSDAYALRISATGTVLDPGGFPVAVDVDNLKVASAPDGTSLVCARDVRRSVRCTRVTADGVVVDLNGGVDVSQEPATALAIATVGDTFFVAWQVAASAAPGSLKVRSLAPADLTMSATQTVATDVYWSAPAGFGGGATEGQLVWARGGPSGGAGDRLEAAVVTPAGFVGNIEPIITPGRDPQAVWTGSDWLITWLEYDTNTLRYTLRGARRLAQGAGLDGAPFVIDTDRAMQPASTALTSAGVLATYSRFVVDPRINNRRVRVRAVP